MRKKGRNKLTALFLVLALVLAAQGCKKSRETAPPVPPAPSASQVQKPVQKPVSSAKGAAAGAIKTLAPVLKPVSSARQGGDATTKALDFSNRKDPFKPYVAPQAPSVKAAAPGTASRRTGELLPIQSFETEKFKVTGIIVGLKQNSALIVDPAGKGYVVREGTQIGSNDGYVRKITPSAIEVEEKFSDDRGKVRKRTVKLTLTRKTKESTR